ncbi:MAG: hypothetical protein ACYC8T_12750 [Myxococcaceae bacterium]
MTRVSGRRGAGPPTRMNMPSVHGAGSAEGAGGVQSQPQPKPQPQPGTPPAETAPAPKRPADEFGKAALRRRKEPSPVGALAGFPFDRLVAAATRIAGQRLPDPRIQHLELTVADGAPALKVSFHDPQLARWFAVRLSHTGEKLWEGHELVGPGTPRWPLVEDLSSLEVLLPDLLAWLKEQLPEARFDFVGLQVCGGGRLVWLAQNTQAFESEPLVEVDASDGEGKLYRFDRAAGRHLLV